MKKTRFEVVPLSVVLEKARPIEPESAVALPQRRPVRLHRAPAEKTARQKRTDKRDGRTK